jgi:Exonuclease VII, large subunit
MRSNHSFPCHIPRSVHRRRIKRNPFAQDYDSQTHCGLSRRQQRGLCLCNGMVSRLAAIPFFLVRRVLICHRFPAEASAVLPSRKQEPMILPTWKELAGSRNLLPAKAKPTVPVIHLQSQKAQVYSDFCQALRDFDNSLPLPSIPTNMLSLAELTNAISTASADVLVLIRGGGKEKQFSVFDHPDLLRIWAGKCAYRVVGLGHSGNTTALDLLSDFVATTPAAAGTHLAVSLRSCRRITFTI